MTTINLLPWREEHRQKQKKDFAVMLGMVAVLAAAIVGLIHFQMQAKIDYQLSRNLFLTNEIKKLDDEIKEIRELQKVRRSLIERMEVIQDLQASRPSIVHLFSEIVSTVPNGVYLESLAQTGSSLLINGQAESNARVSTYMRNLSASEWLKDPNLTVIEIEDITVNRISTFTLTVKQTSPNATGEEEQDDGGLQ
ncbi:MAG: PilN domain-containing protein [Gammaproteobacteria bacterium]|nr:MAG: pilus assembly protein PilN [Gammaproteobacteria bacterium]UCH39821.1 MAG: PilN domain-containing protein [Gammaproteobacteria bacterium]